jgi:hypothetical protein
MRSDTNNIICFLHNPKTAGASLINIIRENYTPLERYSVSNYVLKDIEHEIAGLSEERKKKILLLSGHIEFGIHNFFQGQTVRYFTFLRDPVSRVVSHYHYAKRTPFHHLYDTIHKNNMTLEDYVSSGISLELNNGQVRMLTAQTDMSNKSVAIHGSNDEALLKLAIKNIEDHFDFIGIQEHFKESVSYIGRLYKWRHIKFPQLNVNVEKKTPLSLKEISIIEKNNILDIQLYKYGLTYFNRKLTENPLPTSSNRNILSPILSFFQKRL